MVDFLFKNNPWHGIPIAMHISAPLALLVSVFASE